MSFVTTCFVSFVTIAPILFVTNCYQLSPFVFTFTISSYFSPLDHVSIWLHCFYQSLFDSSSHHSSPLSSFIFPFPFKGLHLCPSVSICQMVPRQTSFVTTCFVSICHHLQPLVAIHRILPFTKIFVAATSRTKSNQMNSCNLLRRQNSVTETKIGTKVLHKHEAISRCSFFSLLVAATYRATYTHGVICRNCCSDMSPGVYRP